MPYIDENQTLIEDGATCILNENWLKDACSRLLISKYGNSVPNLEVYNWNRDPVFLNIFKLAQSDNHGYLLPVEPTIRNQRLLAQQGLFTFLENYRFGFEYNFFNVLRSIEKESIRKPFIPYSIKKIVIPRKIKRKLYDILFDLIINARTLFPGLGGYAKSLHQDLHKLTSEWADGRKPTICPR